MNLISVTAIGICVISMAAICSGQSSDRQDSVADRALQEYKSANMKRLSGTVGK